MQPEGVQEGRHSLHDQQDGYCETSPSEKAEDEKEEAPWAPLPRVEAVVEDHSP